MNDDDDGEAADDAAPEHDRQTSTVLTTLTNNCLEGNERTTG